MKSIKHIIAVSAVVNALNANACLIDFETNALGGIPLDNEIVGLSDVFEIHGVNIQFGFDTNADGVVDTEAVLEQAGNTDAGNDTGFWGIGGARDIAAPGFESVLGNFFLRQFEPYKAFGTFIISYDADTPVTAASGQIWDIDGNNRNTEQFLVQAFNGVNLLQSIFSPLGINKVLNGKPWSFSFSGLSDITRLEISFIGSKSRGIGLAFDNFHPVRAAISASEVNAPATIGLFLLALVTFWRTRHHKNT